VPANIMFSGLMSLWRMPAWCSASSAPATCLRGGAPASASRRCRAAGARAARRGRAARRRGVAPGAGGAVQGRSPGGPGGVGLCEEAAALQQLRQLPAPAARHQQVDALVVLRGRWRGQRAARVGGGRPGARARGGWAGAWLRKSLQLQGAWPPPAEVPPGAARAAPELREAAQPRSTRTGASTSRAPRRRPAAAPGWRAPAACAPPPA
jgi:hypothetical protein